MEYFLPAYFHNWHSLLTGRLPLYDFHIFAGVPHLAVGQTAVFYLPQYLAMFLSERIWGHSFAAIDLLALMHGLIAVAGGYFLLRYLGTTEAAASFGALCALSGFFVWAGRMWPNVPMLCAWFPWMVWAALRYLEKPGVGRAGWLMFFRLGLLFGGQMQFFVLAMIFEHLFVLSYSLAVRRERWQVRCLEYVALDLPTALLGMPLLLPMWVEAGRSLDRARPLSYSEFSSGAVPPIFWVFGQLFAFTQLQIPKLAGLGRSIPYLSYIGYLPTLLMFGAGALWKGRPKSRSWLVACAVSFAIALLWAWNVLGPLIYHLPALNRFRWPFKLVYFTGFFQCLIAAMVLGLFNRKWQRVAIGGFVLNWVVIFCLLPNHAWRIREHHPPLRSPWHERLKGGRYLVVDAGLPVHVSNQFVIRNYSELWGGDNLLGYDPLVPHLNASELLGRSLTDMDLISGTYDGSVDQLLLIHLKKWSVKYVLLGPNRTEYTSELLNAGFKPEAVRQGWTLWEDPDALPRVRWGDAGVETSDAGIHWTEHVNSIDVTLDQWPGRQLVFVFAANPGLETCLDGHCSPVRESADGLIRVEVPPGTRTVRLVYHEPLLLPSVLVALGTLLLYLFLLLRSRRALSHHDPSDLEPPPPLPAPRVN